MEHRIGSLSLRALAFLVLVAAGATAQSFNIDVGANTAFPMPPAAYPGPAAQPGWWEPVDGAAVNHNLHNLMGLTTFVQISVVGGAGNFANNNPGTAGGDQNLYDDLQDVGAAGAVATWTFTNLANGLYDVYTFAWAPDDPAARTRIEIDCSTDVDVVVGGAWPGGHVYAITYAAQRANVTNGTLAVRATAVVGFGSVNGFQLRRHMPTGVAGCFGNGTDNACPCANFGAPGHGCENSLGTGGGLLAAFGTPSVAADSVQLAVSGLPPNATHLYYQGTLPIQPCGAGCFGTPFGDGLRCVAGAVIRIATKTASPCGSSNYPAPGDPTVSAIGGVPAFATRFYQVWYRNAAPAFCTPDTFNLSNGYEINWAP